MSGKIEIGGVRVDKRVRDFDEVIQYKSPDVASDAIQAVVPYTTPELTRAALQAAAACSDLDVQVSLTDIQVVPFPCPLDQPPINREYSEKRLRELLESSGASGEATILYTRNWIDAFRRLLGPRSVVLIATKQPWWPTRESKLARALSRAGHQVMLLPVTR